MRGTQAPRPRVATRDAPGAAASMYISYDDEAPARSATAEIWRDCGRRMLWWTGVFAVLALVVVVMGSLGLLDFYLPMS